tara:strand:- start:527 stop:1156 length:630 start_codon:yes stop_codon:yes gene_type:complete
MKEKEIILISNKEAINTGIISLAKLSYEKVIQISIENNELMDPLKFLKNINTSYSETKNIFFDLFGLNLNTNLAIFCKAIKRFDFINPNIVHPQIKINDNIQKNSNIAIQNSFIDDSVVIKGASYISQFSSIYENCKIGKYTYIGENSIIGKSVELSNFSSIGPNICIKEDLKIGSFCEIFSNSRTLTNSVQDGIIINSTTKKEINLIL